MNKTIVRCSTHCYNQQVQDTHCILAVAPACKVVRRSGAVALGYLTLNLGRNTSASAEHLEQQQLLPYEAYE